MRGSFINKLCMVVYQIIAWALIALCLTMIHQFSLQDGEESSGLSLEVTDVVVTVLHPDEKINRKSEYFQRMHHYVRKAAHATEYMLLALSGMAVLAPYRMRLWKKLFITLFFCCGFAFFDEWTQTMSHGRSPSLKDVMVDSAGALLGCLFALGVWVMSLMAMRSAETLNRRKNRSR